MVKVDTVYEDEFKRILKCSEGKIGFGISYGLLIWI